jgi:hypothetical protein
MGENLSTMSTNAIKVRALQYLNSNSKVLAIGHSDRYESIWNNPQMFPWLFLYGLGGIGSTNQRISDKKHKKLLMMYHDKRFQHDPSFPFVAFSHEQMKLSTSQSWLLAERQSFGDITNRLLQLDQKVLANLTEKMANGSTIKPVTDDEKACFKVLKDLDSISGKVNGSTTSKKYMCNEIWSLIAHCGAPSWYITLSPADIKHPICIYWANSKQSFEPQILSYNKRVSLLCCNPAAGARFFHFVVETFIAEVLGIQANHRGLYGQTNAYYGTVEQQGQLTLHLHLLLWIHGSLNPQELREKILDTNSGWQKNLVAWLESCQMGEFMGGSQIEVEAEVDRCSKSSNYMDPTETLPEAPPPICKKADVGCKKCHALDSWWTRFKYTVDDLLSKSNIHNCKCSLNKDGTHNKKHQYVGCLENKWGKCKARFPRPTYEHTEIDTDTGSLNLKKGEPWLNSITLVITYLFRCNTDVTSLCSGTAIKAVVLYVSDYITKLSLKTHIIFDSIKAVFTKNREMIGGSLPSKEKARQLMMKIVNLLSTKMEMGSPMICIYLLGNPNHYTDHTFIPFYWQNYVAEACRVWHTEEANPRKDKIVLIKQKGKIIGLSPVFDYMYRSPDLESMTLYDWVCRCQRVKLSPSKKNSKKNSKKVQKCSQDDISVECQDDRLDVSCDIAETSFQSSNSSHLSIRGEITRDNTIEPDPNIENSPNRLGRHMFALTNDHPLWQTHATHLAADNENNVPNFIGGTLPRRDQGDRDYYCSTMLVLFKPGEVASISKHRIAHGMTPSPNTSL